MSTVIIKMPSHKVDDLGMSIKEGLKQFGKAMSIYEEMRQQSEGGISERGGMSMRYPVEDDRMYERRGREYDGYNDRGRW